MSTHFPDKCDTGSAHHWRCVGGRWVWPGKQRAPGNKDSCGMHTLTCDVTGAVLTECRCVGEGGCGQVSKELHALKERCPGTCLIAAHVQHVSS